MHLSWATRTFLRGAVMDDNLGVERMFVCMYMCACARAGVYRAAAQSDQGQAPTEKRPCVLPLMSSIIQMGAFVVSVLCRGRSARRCHSA